MTTAKSIIIFDWDGTLMDSVPRIVSCMQKMALEAGLQVPAESAIQNIIGLSLPVALELLFDCHEPDEQQKLIAIYRRYYVDEDATPSPLFAGALELLDELKSRGHVLAVATGKAREGLERAWTETNTRNYFSASCCAYEAPSKPDPTMLQRILVETQYTPDAAFMIGDSRFDLRMAAAAGVPSIGITHGVHDADTLSAESPVYIADDLLNLSLWLQRVHAETA
ncbi:MAG: HAD hydrolase-like protein [Idiomarina sp.]|nr:HAD hydrolase-like protein [Idiomarina sp.]